MDNSIKSALAAQSTKDKLTALAGVVSGNIEDLANAYTSSEDLKMVKIHFHQPLMTVDLGKLDFMAGLDSNGQNYLKSNGSSLKFSCFVQEQKKLKALQESVRKTLGKLCVGNSDYISRDVFYGKFLPYLSDKEKEFDELKDTIGIYYDNELKTFEDNVRNVVLSTCPERSGKAEAAIRFITKRSKESFLAGICFDLETDFSEKGMGDKELAELLRKSKEAYVTRQIEAIYTGQLSELWSAITVYVLAIASAPIDLTGFSTSRNVLKNKALKVEKENIGGIPVISALTDSLKELSKELNRDMANGIAFDIMSEIVGRGTEFGSKFQFPKSLPEWVNEKDLLDNYSAAITAA
ncbi:MAG: hypothetical protein IKW90_06965 [Lachnospiraceae bacterium]|nr:hypothetical protein [Lachnospiraceae bacterium]